VLPVADVMVDVTDVLLVVTNVVLNAIDPAGFWPSEAHVAGMTAGQQATDVRRRGDRRNIGVLSP
jgi:hypothetical protein